MSIPNSLNTIECLIMTIPTNSLRLLDKHLATGFIDKEICFFIIV
jgi:hypothetical protein